MASSDALPLVDFAPFYREGDEDGKRKVVEEIRKACSEYGFFQVVNHGIPLELLKQALEVYRAFFDLSDEEKLKSLPRPGVNPSRAYFRSPDLSKEGNEHFLMISSDLSLNPYPNTLPRFQYALFLLSNFSFQLITFNSSCMLDCFLSKSA